MINVNTILRIYREKAARTDANFNHFIDVRLDNWIECEVTVNNIPACFRMTTEPSSKPKKPRIRTRPNHSLGDDIESLAMLHTPAFLRYIKD